MPMPDRVSDVERLLRTLVWVDTRCFIEEIYWGKMNLPEELAQYKALLATHPASRAALGTLGQLREAFDAVGRVEIVFVYGARARPCPETRIW